MRASKQGCPPLVVAIGTGGKSASTREALATIDGTTSTPDAVDEVIARAVEIAKSVDAPKRASGRAMRKRKTDSE